MSIKKIFTVYDAKSEAYLPPFFVRSLGEATRSFSDACNDTKHDFFRHSSDFTLFELGSFDELTGILTPLPSPVARGNAVEFKGVDSD